MGASIQCTSDPGKTPLLSRSYRGLIMVAILAGMASAAAIVLFQSLRSLNNPIHLASRTTSIKIDKPSAFGTVLASPSAPDEKLSEPQIVKAGNRAIVTVTGWDQNDEALAQGPGYVYSANGIIVTSYSAIRGASSVTVETAAGEELNVIALMGYSVSRDLAVVAVLEGNLPALETGPGDVVQEGDAVVAIGPGNATSKGVVGPRRAIGGVDFMQISASALSGSPVLNEHAKVIGLATRRHGETLAIPSRYISDLLAEHRVISFDQMLQETAQQ